METEIIDKLYLELSQITSATSKKEFLLHEELIRLRAENNRLKSELESIRQAQREMYRQKDDGK